MIIDRQMKKATSSFIKFSGNLIIMLVLFIACLLIVFLAAHLAFSQPNNIVDDNAFAEVSTIRNAIVTRFFQFITLFGGQNFLLPAWIAVFLYFIAVKSKRFYFWKVAIVGITGTAVMFGLKRIFERERPEVPLISKAHGYSFPSGHSFSGVLFFGLIAYFIYKSEWPYWLKTTSILLLIALMLLIGISRVYLSVHYATDVIAGWLLGFMWLMLAKYFLIDRRRKLSPDNTRVFS